MPPSDPPVRWREVLLDKHHDRRRFDCSEPALNTFLARYARQNQKSNVARTFVAVQADEPTRILGFYSLAPTSIAFEQLPDALARALPRYPLPAYLLARLAVDKTVQGQGLGGQLFLSAGERCLAAAREVGGVFMLIDAKNERAAAWYERFGGVPSRSNPLLLVFPLSVIEALF